MGEPILRIKTEDEVMLVEQKYWDRFLKTGKITDYLDYKGMESGLITDRFEGAASGESNNSDRNGAAGSACRGI